MQFRHIRVHAQYQLGAQRKEHGKRQYERIGYADMLPYRTGHAVGVSCSDKGADKRPAGWSECHHNHEHYARYVADDVGNGQRTFSQMLYVKEEQEPRGEWQEILYHRPERDVEHAFEYVPADTRYFVQSVLADVDTVTGVEDEEYQWHQFRQRRAYGGSGNAERWETEFTENQDIIEYHIR